MKILHISDEGLPDIRLNRFSYLDNQLGHDSYFVGGKQQTDSSLFNYWSEIYYLLVTPAIMLQLPRKFSNYKKELLKLVNKLGPDLIQAHNYITAKACMDLKLDFIYNDHEYWKYQIKARSKQQKSRFSKRQITDRLFQYNIWRNERKILNKAKAVITVSDPITEDHKKINPNSFTISNFLCKKEFKLINSLEFNEKPKIAYITKNSNKNLSNLSNDITILTNKSHKELIQLLSKYDVGLTDFEYSKELVGYFKYSSPNRVFLYVSCGVIPIIHKEMDYLKRILPCYLEFPSYEIIISTRQTLKEFASKNFVLDQYLPELDRIYRETIQ